MTKAATTITTPTNAMKTTTNANAQTQNSLSRSQWRKSCQFCRRRKIKCVLVPGGPACNACKIRGFDCCFAPVGSHDDDAINSSKSKARHINTMSLRNSTVGTTLIPYGSSSSSSASSSLSGHPYPHPYPYSQSHSHPPSSINPFLSSSSNTGANVAYRTGSVPLHPSHGAYYKKEGSTYPIQTDYRSTGLGRSDSLPTTTTLRSPSPSSTAILRSRHHSLASRRYEPYTVYTPVSRSSTTSISGMEDYTTTPSPFYPSRCWRKFPNSTVRHDSPYGHYTTTTTTHPGISPASSSESHSMQGYAHPAVGLSSADVATPVSMRTYSTSSTSLTPSTASSSFSGGMSYPQYTSAYPYYPETYHHNNNNNININSNDTMYTSPDTDRKQQHQQHQHQHQDFTTLSIQPTCEAASSSTYSTYTPPNGNAVQDDTGGSSSSSSATTQSYVWTTHTPESIQDQRTHALPVGGLGLDSRSSSSSNNDHSPLTVSFRSASPIMMTPVLPTTNTRAYKDYELHSSQRSYSTGLPYPHHQNVLYASPDESGSVAAVKNNERSSIDHHWSNSGGCPRSYSYPALPIRNYEGYPSPLYAASSATTSSPNDAPSFKHPLSRCSDMSINHHHHHHHHQDHQCSSSSMT